MAASKSILSKYLRLGREHVCSSFTELLYALLAAPEADLDAASAAAFGTLASTAYCEKCFASVHDLALRFIKNQPRPNALTALLLMSYLSSGALTSWWLSEPQWRFTAMAHDSTCSPEIREVFCRFGLLLDETKPAGLVFTHYRSVCHARATGTQVPLLAAFAAEFPNDRDALIDAKTGVNAVAELLQSCHRVVTLGVSRDAAAAAMRDIAGILELGTAHAARDALLEALRSNFKVQELAGFVLLVQPAFPTLTPAAAWCALPCLLQHAEFAQLSEIVQHGHFDALGAAMCASKTECKHGASFQDARHVMCWRCHFSRCAPLNHVTAKLLLLLCALRMKSTTLPDDAFLCISKEETERAWCASTPAKEQLIMLCARAPGVLL